jgi:excisionase family DNA binding protein
MNQIPIISYSVKTAAMATGYSRSYLYVAIQGGNLRTFKRGGRVFILADELKRFIHSEAMAGSLPDSAIKKAEEASA